MTPCSLCRLDCGTKPIRVQEDGVALTFCCIGCLGVHATLRERGMLKPGVDPRETELFKRRLELGLVSTRAKSERKDLIIRMGVAASLWLSLILLNFAIESGHFGGVPADLRRYVPFVVMGLTALVILYSANTIFKRPWHRAVHWALGTEALLMLAIVTTFAYGTYNTLHGSNQIYYFDLACGITALTLLEKWIEHTAKQKVVAPITAACERMLRERPGAGGEASALAEILHAMEGALSKRSKIERATGRLTYISMPLVVMFAAGLAVGSGDVRRAVSVLVIACPCALAIAAPLASTAAVGAALRRGIVISDDRLFESIRNIDAVVLEKTGIITEGRFELLEARDDDLPMIAAVERHSGHALGRAVMERLAKSGQKASVATGIEKHPGLGISGLVGVGRLYIGSWRLFERVELDHDPKTEEGRTIVYYGWDRILAGRLVFSDRIRPDAGELVAKLRDKRIRTIVVSGDSIGATKWASQSVGADEFRADMPPGRKAELIEDLQKQGLTVAVIGDGLNDAPALAAANVGIAMGGAHAPMKGASVILMNDDLGGVIELLSLSRRMFGAMRQNLSWAFAYNAVGLVFGSIGMLDPLIASSAMAVSSLCVTANALRIDRKR